MIILINRDEFIKNMEVKDFPNYLIYDDGRVYSKKTKKFLKQSIQKNGYYTISLCKDNKSKTFLIHRLIALHYIPLIDDKDIVDHIDQNKRNNNLCNLRWVNSSQSNLNKKVYKTNKLNHKNIFLSKSSTYKVEIQRNNKRVYCKSFKTLDEAIIKRDEFLMS